ncbi:MAG: hypothetical protein M0R17_01005 [Candidatus Omnitrophica bacterium]|jgi:hypothetical protein|nr:hypothetical protein [Candidatus Omnitrophota bacterium]
MMKRYLPKSKNLAENAGKHYTEPECQKILRDEKNKIPAHNTAKDLKRTDAAINDKREDLKNKGN